VLAPDGQRHARRYAIMRGSRRHSPGKSPMSTNAAEMSWEEIKALVAELAIQVAQKDTHLALPRAR